MRTTLTLDDDVAALLKREERARGLSFKQLVNDALRRGLNTEVRSQVCEPLPAYRLGTLPGIDLMRALALSAELEDEALLARLKLGR